MEFKSMKDLMAYIEKEKQDSLETDVAKMAREKVQDHVVSDVYNAYSPTGYHRTGQLFSDVESEMVNGDTVEIKDTRHDYYYDGSYKDVVKIIETGRGYTYSPNLDERIGPRPFIANARKEIEQDHLATETLKESLAKKGIKTE